MIPASYHPLNGPWKPCPVHVCFMRLLNLQLDLLLYQMSDPKKSHGAQPGLSSYTVYQVTVLRPLPRRRHASLHAQTDYAGADKITGIPKVLCN